ncbi:MAG: flagellar basal body rod protein FlgB [Lachnospiraceae bacterium]|nr:flagellar basal body rod protein FlgB [Lachnospiraceae bacterium]
MINSDAFSYINVLDKAADASYTRETLIANNIANADTPTYKRKDIDFQSVLEKELREGSTQYSSMDAWVKNMDTSELTAQSYTDYANYSYRIDKNNVDIDTENVELASEQLRYQQLTTAVSQEFSHLKTAIGS